MGAYFYALAIKRKKQTKQTVKDNSLCPVAAASLLIDILRRSFLVPTCATSIGAWFLLSYTRKSQVVFSSGHLGMKCLF